MTQSELELVHEGNVDVPGIADIAALAVHGRVLPGLVTIVEEQSNVVGVEGDLEIVVHLVFVVQADFKSGVEVGEVHVFNTHAALIRGNPSIGNAASPVELLQDFVFFVVADVVDSEVFL